LGKEKEWNKRKIDCGETPNRRKWGDTAVKGPMVCILIKIWERANMAQTSTTDREGTEHGLNKQRPGEGPSETEFSNTQKTSWEEMRQFNLIKGEGHCRYKKKNKPGGG